MGKDATLVVGLTGGVASGKSAAAAQFERLGVRVIDTDQLAREVVAPGRPALDEIRAAFGDEVLAPDGGLDRRAMRERVFDDEAARKRLEAILHPRIGELLERRLEAVSAAYCIVAIPLLVEAGWVDRVDRVLVVDVPESLQMSRLTARDGLSEDQARRMVEAQASREDRLRVAHDVLDNSGSLEDLAALVAELDAAYRHGRGGAA